MKHQPILTAFGVVVLTLAACGTSESADSIQSTIAPGTATTANTEETTGATTTAATPATSEVTTPELSDPYDSESWDVDADLATVRQAFSKIKVASQVDGYSAGVADLGASAYPSITVESLLKCIPQTEDTVIDLIWAELTPDPGWTHPYTDITPSDDGYRVYIGQVTDLFQTKTGHVSVNDAGEVQHYPGCDSEFFE